VGLSEVTVFRRRNTIRARELRNNATPAERALWLQLQGRKLDGYKFSRQLDIDGKHPDFICRSHRLIVELDGESHDFTGVQDLTRTRRLERAGYRVIRFTNEEVFKHMDGVLVMIAEALRVSPTPLATRVAPPASGRGNG
jgi:very-short-patch-repair endonuclease